MKTPLVLLAAVMPVLLGGCGAFFRINAEVDPQAAVNRRVVGMTLGEFFDRYGAPTRREESAEGVLGFNWSSGSRYVAPGPVGPEEQFCRLRIVGDRNGRIVSAPILRDGRGDRHQSRCVEVFSGDADSPGRPANDRARIRP